MRAAPAGPRYGKRKTALIRPTMTLGGQSRRNFIFHKTPTIFFGIFLMSKSQLDEDL
jgi:hypothetical protein